jgi:NAD(P)-dependent dehydrogenase (short-subunit alcohol dehydrogenase family)
MNLHRKTILITGGRRVGAELAVELARRGTSVALSYFKSRERIEAVAEDGKNRTDQLVRIGVYRHAGEGDGGRLLVWLDDGFGDARERFDCALSGFAGEISRDSQERDDSKDAQGRLL